MTCILHGLGILVQRAPCDLQRRLYPLRPSPAHLLRRDIKIQSPALGVDGDPVAVSHQRDGAALLRLGHDMADEKAVAAAAEAAVGDEGDVVAEPGAHDGRAGLEHLRHAGAAAGSFVADDDDGLVAPADDVALLERGDEVVLVLVHPGRADEAEALFACDLADAAVGREAAAEDLDVAGLLDGVAERTDDLLVGREGWRFSYVFGKCLAGYGHSAAVDQAFLEQKLQ